MTKISFTDAHLQTIETALEVYCRLKLGQFNIAIDEAFPEAWLSWEEREQIHKTLRDIIMPEAPRLAYDGHGGYYDQYGNAYNEQQEILPESINSKDYYAKSNFLVRANKNKLLGGLNSSYGIGSDQIGDGNIAYEIRQTIRQYLTVKNNDGFFDYMHVGFDDPLEVSSEPLPVIEGFVKEKVFPVSNKEINTKLNRMFKAKKPNWPKMWELVENNCQKPDNLESQRRRLNFNDETKQWELILEKPVRRKQSNEI